MERVELDNGSETFFCKIFNVLLVECYYPYETVWLVSILSFISYIVSPFESFDFDFFFVLNCMRLIGMEEISMFKIMYRILFRFKSF